MSDLKIFTDNIEPTALNQIYTLSLRKLVKSSSFLSICVMVVSSVSARVMRIGTVQLLMVLVE